MANHRTGNRNEWLDRAPLGRNEGEMSWFACHDRYDANYR